MKKTLRFLFVAFVLALSITVSAAAASFTSLADDLKDIGVFQGTSAGYELDREANRIEAAVMLVRLLGEEKNAAAAFEAGTIAHPFTDVPDWADSYVAYLYTNKMASGMNETEYGPAEICSAQMYCTFMLRALGYSDQEGGDFTYAGALDFAEETGIADSMLLSGKFTRDSLVAVSYQALATDVKGGDGTLLSKLIASGAIDADAASNITKKLAIYDKINSASTAMNDAASIEADATMDVTIAMSGTTVTLNDMAIQLKMNMTDESIEAEIIVTMVDPTSKETITVKEWMKDGWLYMDDGTQKSKIKMDYSEMLATIKSSSMSSAPSPIYYFNGLTETTTNGEAEYTVSMAPEFLTNTVGAFLNQTVGDMQSLSIEFKNITQVYRLDKNGALKTIGMQIDMSMTEPSLGKIDALLNYDMTLKSIGNTVTINFPDFSGYEELAA